MQQVVRRSISRAVTKRELWNGNREYAREWIKADHPIRWAWSQHARKRVEYEARFREPQYARIEVQRFRTPAAARDWLHKF
jgi:hypothetical protein